MHEQTHLAGELAAEIVLDGHDPLHLIKCLAQTLQAEVDAAGDEEAGDEHDGDVLGDGGVVRGEAGRSCGLAPVRRQDHEHIGARGGGEARELDGLTRVEVAVGGDDEGPAVDVIHRHLCDLRDLGVGQRDVVAVTGGQDDRPTSGVDVEVDDASQTVEIDTAVLVKWCAHRGDGAGQGLPHSIPIDHDSLPRSSVRPERRGGA